MDSKLISRKYKDKINIPWYIIFALICFIISRFIKDQGIIVDKYYSSSINKWVTQGISQATGLFPFSLGEILYVGHLIAIPVVVIALLYKTLKGGFVPFFNKVLTYFCIVYVTFMLMWGFNYSRASIGVILDLQTRFYAQEELYKLNEALIIKANALRLEIAEDSNGVMYIMEGYKDVFTRAHKGYDIIGKNVKALSGNYGRPKSIALSYPMLYTGITGMYFPFTAEVNVNTAIPHMLLPATVLHEMAHQRGFASEDEANYIAYLTASAHADIDFQYSGTILALLHSMNALYAQEPELYFALRETYSEGLERDIRYYNEFWKAYEGKGTEVANKVNDTYLKSNGQKDGTKSYGKMVDLLIAHFLKHGEV